MIRLQKYLTPETLTGTLALGLGLYHLLLVSRLHLRIDHGDAPDASHARVQPFVSDTADGEAVRRRCCRPSGHRTAGHRGRCSERLAAVALEGHRLQWRPDRARRFLRRRRHRRSRLRGRTPRRRGHSRRDHPDLLSLPVRQPLPAGPAQQPRLQLRAHRHLSDDRHARGLRHPDRRRRDLYHRLHHFRLAAFGLRRR